MQNTGSTARDHLASERTFLSWLRTGLGFIALGMGVERFSRLEAANPESMPGNKHQTRVSKEVQRKKQQDQDREQLLVAGLLGIGTSCIVYGAARYFSNLKLMTKGLYKPAYGGAASLSVAVAALAGGAWMGLAMDEAERNDALKTVKK